MIDTSHRAKYYKVVGPRRGEDHPRAVLTDHDIDLIRSLVDEGVPLVEVAEKFGITKGYASKLANYLRR